MSVELFNRILKYIDNPETGDFDSLAIELFSRQYELNAVYRLYSDRLDKTPRNVSSWRDIPAVPSTAFKTVELSCIPAAHCETVFYSSGTTQKLSGKHWMDRDALALYAHSLSAGYQKAVRSVFGDYPIWAMAPSISDSPHSSLSHMMYALHTEKWWWEDWSFLSDALERLTYPIQLFGTGFAFASLFDLYPDKRWPLPEGSIVINTGGFKGRTREIDHDEFYAMLRDRFQIPDSSCVAEYGMSEMSSQFYSETGSDCAPGQVGALCHFDLANWNSALAIQTQDGAIYSDSPRIPLGCVPFRLIGRLEGAEIRGCSLTVEELWAKQI